MMFAQIFIIAYEKNIDIEPKPFENGALLDFAWMFTELAEKTKPNCSTEIREHIKDLKNSIEV